MPELAWEMESKSWRRWVCALRVCGNTMTVPPSSRHSRRSNAMNWLKSAKSRAMPMLHKIWIRWSIASGMVTLSCLVSLSWPALVMSKWWRLEKCWCPSQVTRFVAAMQWLLWALMISRSASLCEILGARTGVTRAISTCLTSTFAIHNWHKTFGPSISSKISRRLRQRESKSRSFLEVVPGGVKTYLHHAEHQYLQTLWRRLCFQNLFGCERCIASSTSGECVRYVGLTPPSCVEKSTCYVFLRSKWPWPWPVVVRQGYYFFNCTHVGWLDENIWYFSIRSCVWYFAPTFEHFDLVFDQGTFFTFHFIVPLDFAVKISQASLFFHRRFQGACVCVAFLWQLFTM